MCPASRLYESSVAGAYLLYKAPRWIAEQAMHDEDLKDTVTLMQEEVQALRGLLLKTEHKLRELMRDEDFRQNSALLRSVPGVGPLTAMLFLLEVRDVNRFKSFDALNRFVGLCPDSHSSGQRLTPVYQYISPYP
jgi:transposase